MPCTLNLSSKRDPPENLLNRSLDDHRQHVRALVQHLVTREPSRREGDFEHDRAAFRAWDYRQVKAPGRDSLVALKRLREPCKTIGMSTAKTPYGSPEPKTKGTRCMTPQTRDSL